MPEEKCLCEGSKNVIYACSGAANVGQIANQAALELMQEGIGKMNCAVALGGHISGMIASGMAAERIIAIDGCPVQCVQKTLEHIGFSPTDYILVTDLEIEKTPGRVYFTEDEVNKVKQAALQSIKKEKITQS